MKSLNQLLLTGCVALFAAGCASSPSHFYTLDATAKRASAPDATYGVLVGPVLVPAAVERPQFVVTTAPNRVEVDEFNRWDAPLGGSIARVVSRNLGEQLGTLRVASAPMPSFGPAYHVAIRVEQFESVRGQGKSGGMARVNAAWSVSNPKDEFVASGVFALSEPATDDSFEALAAAHSRVLAKLSDAIAEAIRQAAK